MNRPEKLDIERRVALFAALVGALAGLVGALIGVAGSVYVQNVAATQSRKAEEQRAKEEACAAFVTSAHRVHLLLNQLYLSSSYGPAQPRSQYVRVLNRVSDDAVPEMYGQQAAVQLITDRRDVSESSTNWVNELVKEINYFQLTIGKADATIRPGLIEVDKYRELGNNISKARGTFIANCSNEVGSA